MAVSSFAIQVFFGSFGPTLSFPCSGLGPEPNCQTNAVNLGGRLQLLRIWLGFFVRSRLPGLSAQPFADPLLLSSRSGHYGEQMSADINMFGWKSLGPFEVSGSFLNCSRFPVSSGHAIRSALVLRALLHRLLSSIAHCASGAGCQAKPRASTVSLRGRILEL